MSGDAHDIHELSERLAAHQARSEERHLALLSSVDDLRKETRETTYRLIKLIESQTKATTTSATATEAERSKRWQTTAERVLGPLVAAIVGALSAMAASVVGQSEGP
jgi:hypothetical protein